MPDYAILVGYMPDSRVMNEVKPKWAASFRNSGPRTDKASLIVEMHLVVDALAELMWNDA